MNVDRVSTNIPQNFLHRVAAAGGVPPEEIEATVNRVAAAIELPVWIFDDPPPSVAAEYNRLLEQILPRATEK